MKALNLTLLIWTGAAMAAAPAAPEDRPDAVVAADGSGQFLTIQQAVNASPGVTGPVRPWTISIRPGTYRELVYVQREKRHLRLVGADPEATVLTYDLRASLPGPDGRPIGTFRTATAQIDADDFTAENLTFANSAGAKGQALAVRVDGDRAVFRRCRFLGWQDTILDNRGRHYYERCTICGAVDFIFGGATSLYDHCRIICLGDGYITAASTPSGEAFGLVFADCTIDGANDAVRTYLGRPWRPHGAATFLRTRMSAVVRPAGWNDWGQPDRQGTARFTEYGSFGPGAAAGGRAAWARRLTDAEAAAITLSRVLGGADGWSP